MITITEENTSKENDSVSKSELSALLAVIGVAIIAKGGMMCSLPKPKRHHDVIRAMAASGMDTPIIGEQGFLLSDGTFATRKQAAKIAIKANQLLSRSKGLEQLFSEDVW